MQVNDDFGRASRIAEVGRWRVSEYVREVAANLPSGARVLDAGAGECAYKRHFTHCRYVGFDLAVGNPDWNYHNLDCIGTLDRLPFAEGSLDAVLSTQTLEHVEYPAECVAEMYRVLKPGGALFLTAPMAHMEHQVPHDFFRYTSYGLRSLAARAGFERVDVQPFGGMFTRWAYELPAALDPLPKAGLGTGHLRARGLALLPLKAALLGLIRVSQAGLIFLDRFDYQKRYPFGWRMNALKPRKAEPLA